MGCDTKLRPTIRSDTKFHDAFVLDETTDNASISDLERVAVISQNKDFIENHVSMLVTASPCKLRLFPMAV